MDLYTEFDPQAPPTTVPDDRVVVVEAAAVPVFLRTAPPGTPAVAIGDTPDLPSVPDRSGDFDAAVDRALADDVAVDVSPPVRAALTANREPVLPDALARALPSALAARAAARPAFTAALQTAARRAGAFLDDVGLGDGLARALTRSFRPDGLFNRDHDALFSVPSLAVIGSVLAEATLRDIPHIVLPLRPAPGPVSDANDRTSPLAPHPIVWGLAQAGFDRRSLGLPTRGDGDAPAAPPSATFVDADGTIVRVETDPDTGDAIVGPVRRPGEPALSDLVVLVRRDGQVVARLSDAEGEFPDGARVRVPAPAVAAGDEIVLLSDSDS